MSNLDKEVSEYSIELKNACRAYADLAKASMTDAVINTAMQYEAVSSKSLPNLASMISKMQLENAENVLKLSVEKLSPNDNVIYIRNVMAISSALMDRIG